MPSCLDQKACSENCLPEMRRGAMNEHERAWRAQAACKDHPHPDIFHPRPNDLHMITEAKAVCAGCPVRAECAEYGMAFDHGIWGGLTEAERRAIRPQRLKKRTVTPLDVPPRQCDECSRQYAPLRYNQRYCSRSCGEKQRGRNNRIARGLGFKPRQCIDCGTEFTPNSSSHRYCTKKCSMRVRNLKRATVLKRPTIRTCPKCGAEFTPHKGQRFCNRKCTASYHQEQYRKRQADKGIATKLRTRESRGRCNSNERGSSYARRSRRVWLLSPESGWGGDGLEVPCSECGQKVNGKTLIVDRIIPGAQGGRYTRDNIKPHCPDCSNRQGNRMTQDLRKAKAS